MLGQINSSQITKTITWVFIRVNPLEKKLMIFRFPELLRYVYPIFISSFRAFFIPHTQGISWKNSFQTGESMVYYHTTNTVLRTCREVG